MFVSCQCLQVCLACVYLHCQTAMWARKTSNHFNEQSCAQSAIMGFGLFKSLQRYQLFQGFTMEENVILQTTAVATATMPLAAGMVGVVPAMTLLTTSENPGGPIFFSAGQLAYVAMLHLQHATRQGLQRACSFHASGPVRLHQVPMDGQEAVSSLTLVVSYRLWSLALAFLGVFCAVPLRTQTILKEKLRFPSGGPWHACCPCEPNVQAASGS